MNTDRTRTRSGKPIQFSLLFFSSNEAGFSEDKYQLLFEATEFADRHGFKAVWVPERHFNAVGGLFPNPSVIAAALAVKTKSIRIRAGSVVAPLHHAVRIAEEWSVVDNLSNGRVDAAFARGWNPNDFILSPQTFSRDNQFLLSQIELVRKLWRGEAAEFPNALGQPTPVKIFPLPEQKELEVWLSCFGNLERFREAAIAGANILTMISNQTLQDMGTKIEVYRQLRRERGHSGPGTITLMLHTLVHRDLEFVKAKVREPFLNYIKTTLNLHQQGIPERRMSDREKNQIAEYSYERYFRTAALFGTPESCLPLVDAASDAGIDEIACQIDFGVDRPSVIEALQYLVELRDRCAEPRRVSRQPLSEDASVTESVVRSVNQFQELHRFDSRDLLKCMAVLDRLGRGWLVQVFQSMGVFLAPDETWLFIQLQEKLKVARKYEKLLSRLLQLLARHGLLEIQDTTIRTTEMLGDPEFLAAQNRLSSLKARLLETVPDARPQVTLLEKCLTQYPGLLQGRVNPTDVIFSGGSIQVMEKVYSGNRVSDHFNGLLAEALAAAVVHRIESGSNEKVRIIEVGAGTGASSAAVLSRLAPLAEHISYFYTDIGPAFVNHGEAKFAGQFPFASFQCLDIGKDPAAQGFPARSIDFVLATNVFHATHSLIGTLRHTRTLFKAGGLLFLNESTRAPDFLMLIFGLTPGWWLFEDSELRIEDSPLLRCSQWREAFVRAGFKISCIAGSAEENEDDSYQSLLVGEAQAVAPAPNETKAPPQASSISRTQDIAIIGMAGRFPGVRSLDEFWQGLIEGKNLTSEVSSDRWPGKPFYSPDIRTPNTTYSRHGGFLDGIDLFDPLFFGISPREAASMDPQQRLFLQEAWNAFEDAGYSIAALAGRKVGVFLGAGSSDYLDVIEAGPGLSDGFLLTGNTPSTYAGRVAHFFDLKGPCLTIDTACSSSLVAVHLACASIWSGESEMALAGGISVLTTPKATIVTSKTGLMSQSGVLRPLDDRADGYVIGEAVNALVLKPLEAALRDGDPIHGVIKGSAINHGGKKNGMLAPSPLGQTALQVEVFNRSGIHPESISYVEAHATGTRLGDAMEVNALTASFRSFTEKKQFCAVGSLKGNVGHSGHPSGISEMIKVLLAFRHGVIPPTINLTTPNQAVNWPESPFFVTTECRSWPVDRDRPRRAGVNSLGHSGTNAFIILEEPPAISPSRPSTQTSFLVTLSARTATALARRALDLAEWIARHGEENLAAISFTLNARRTHFAFRVAFIVESLSDLSEKLRCFADGGEVEHQLAAAPGQERKDSLQAVEKESDLLKLARAWLEGREIDWKSIQPQAQTISLPTYPFARERYWAEEATPRLDDSVDLPLLTPVWRDEPLSHVRDDSFDGPILVFGRSEQFIPFRNNPTRKAFFVTAGSVCHIASDRAQIRRTEFEDYLQLLESLRERDLVPIRVLHLWNFHSNDTAQEFESNALSDIQKKLELGLESLFLLVKAISTVTSRPQLDLVYAYSTAEPQARPEFACVSGLLRSIQHENAKIRAKSVHFVNDAPPGREFADCITAELANFGNSEVRYHLGKRQVRSVEIMDRNALPLGPSSVQQIGQGKTYLITGGLGGLGLVFAQHLAGQYQANLVLLGRSELSPGKKEQIEKMPETRVHYYPVDIADPVALAKTLEKVKTRHGAIHGVLHCAGVIQDALLHAKTLDSFRQVLEPKIAGTVNLDALTQSEPLEFFVLFSSLVSLTGNLGQGDYASANRYLDSFAELREQWRAGGLRQGKTVSINWPYWQDGGMRFPAETARLLEQLFGMKAMTNAQGLALFHAALAAPHFQVSVAGADPEQVRRLVEGNLKIRTDTKAKRVEPKEDSVASLEKDLVRLVATLLAMDAHRIDVDTHFSEFGMDSRIFTQLAFELNQKYSLRLAPAQLFGHSTLRELAQFLVAEYPEETGGAGLSFPVVSSTRAPQEQKPNPFPDAGHEPIAIVGLAGIYPQAANIQEFWKLLINNEEAIREIPPSRWDWKKFHGDPAEAAGVSLSRYGGFIDDLDCFDSLFFNISPREASFMDPRQRLFLQTVWTVLEDAGHKPEDSWNSRTGLFVGAQGNDYADVLGERTEPEMAAGLSPAMLANRVSYFFNWRGPSEIIDTGCSSAAVGLHRAIQAIRHGECEQAVVGGVNLVLSPRPHLLLSQLGLLSSESRSKIYDKDGAGYLRGEGIGAVFLKPLSRALHDRDPIYATVIGSAQVQNGRTASIGLPNPLAQSEALLRSWREAGVDPETITYMETQGTGTPNGDQAELVALKMAFAKGRAERGSGPARENFCAIGCLKPNIGHLETTSALAAFSKVALALKNQMIPATLNLPRESPELDLEESPFYLQRETCAWDLPASKNGRRFPRRAGVNSFGFGGTVVHLLLEEAPELAAVAVEVESPCLFVLSAKSEEQLRVYAECVKSWLTDISPAPALRDLSWTFQTGREAMDFRLAVIVRTNEELRQKLAEFLRGENSPSLFSGRAVRGGRIANEASLTEIGSAWVQGAIFEWDVLSINKTARKISAPAYPFAGERHWAPVGTASNGHPAVPTNGHSSDVVLPPHRNGAPHLIDEMHSLIAGLLQVKTAILPIDEPLVKFGADSIFLMLLMRTLRRKLGVRIKVDELVAAQTIQGIAGLIESRHPNLVPAEALATVDREITAAEARELLGSLEEMSDQEVDALLYRLDPASDKSESARL